MEKTPEKKNIYIVMQCIITMFMLLSDVFKEVDCDVKAEPVDAWERDESHAAINIKSWEELANGKEKVGTPHHNEN